jgi:hypothetical protein
VTSILKGSQESQGLVISKLLQMPPKKKPRIGRKSCKTKNTADHDADNEKKMSARKLPFNYLKA